MGCAKEVLYFLVQLELLPVFRGGVAMGHDVVIEGCVAVRLGAQDASFGDPPVRMLADRFFLPCAPQGVIDQQKLQRKHPSITGIRCFR